MRNIIKVSLYGTVCVMYSCALLFGILYPQYGIPENSVVYEEEYQETNFNKEADGKTGENKKLQVKYKSYYYEKIKELFKDKHEIE